MSTPIIIWFHFILLILSPMQKAMGRHYPILPSAPSTALPSVSKTGDFATLKPSDSDHKKRVFRQRDIKNCMPKGSRRSSAPSRYVNYHALGSLRCSTGRQP
ncbi:hypothetical protein ABFS83_04G200500 [Erythranthe nasuta]